jgi:hypothetical protein
MTVQRGCRVALVAIVVGVVAAGLVAQLRGHTEIPTLFRSGDTAGLVAGADVARECLADGVTTECAYPAPPLRIGSLAAPMSGVDRFALLLYVPSISLRAVGFSRSATLWGIGVLNAIGLLFLFFLPWLIRVRVPGLYRQRFLWALVILAGPLLPYGFSTWSEAFAAALVAGAVLAVAARWPAWAVVPLVLAAGISKETMVPFVVLLCFAVVPNWSNTTKERARIAAPVIAGAVLAVVANVAFNLFRYGTPQNLTYQAGFFHVYRPWDIAAQLAAVGISPNGGIAAFWPTAVVCVTLIVLAARRGGPRCWLRLGVVGAVGIGYALSLAMWYSPFGWHAWGPRLMLPIVPGMVLAGLAIAGERDGPWNTRPARVAMILTTLVALPNVSVLHAQPKVSAFMTAPSSCPRPGDDPFVHCTIERAWARPWLSVDVLSGFRNPLTGALGALVVVGAVILVKVSVQRPSSQLMRTPPRDPHAEHHAR